MHMEIVNPACVRACAYILPLRKYYLSIKEEGSKRSGVYKDATGASDGKISLSVKLTRFKHQYTVIRSDNAIGSYPFFQRIFLLP